MSTPEERQQAAEALTSLLFRVHDEINELLPRSVAPKALVVDFRQSADGLRGRIFKSADNAFMAMWARGSFPGGTKLSLWNDSTDRQLGNESISWSTVEGRPWYFGVPFLIPPNATITVTTSAPGDLTLHGVIIFRRHALHNEDRGQSASEVVDDLRPKLAKIMRILQLTDTLIG